MFHSGVLGWVLKSVFGAVLLRHLVLYSAKLLFLFLKLIVLGGWYVTFFGKNWEFSGNFLALLVLGRGWGRKGGAGGKGKGQWGVYI